MKIYGAGLPDRPRFSRSDTTAADLAALPKIRPLLVEPLFHISGEVFKSAQGSHIDLHMLAVFFHDRQIEQNLVEHVWTIHIGDSHHTPRAHTFPDVENYARLLCPQSGFGFAGQIEKKSFCDMDAGYSMWKST
jgi:hypothetical protein